MRISLGPPQRSPAPASPSPFFSRKLNCLVGVCSSDAAGRGRRALRRAAMAFLRLLTKPPLRPFPRFAC